MHLITLLGVQSSSGNTPADPLLWTTGSANHFLWGVGPDDILLWE